MNTTASVSTREPAWRRAPSRLRLGSRAVHLWRANLAAVSNDVLATLSNEEHARAERFHQPDRRLLWARSRGILRLLLGQYLKEDPHRVRFVADRSGKPRLSQPLAGTSPGCEGAGRIAFNLSHSGDIALYAVSGAGQVGVDLEVGGRIIDWNALAPRAFGACEQAYLERLSPVMRNAHGFRLWVLREATLKCRGTGIAGGMVARPDDRALWTLGFDLEPRGFAALALSQRPVHVAFWEWPHGSDR